MTRAPQQTKPGDSQTPTSIGIAGRVSRAAVGLGLIALALFWRDPEWQDPVLGLVVVPAIIAVALTIYGRRSSTQLSATGPIAHVATVAIGIALLLIPATAGAAFFFYGGSMLVAAARSNGGCEVTAISNAVLGRDDQLGCALFAPVDAAEETSRSSGAPAAGR